MKRLERPHTCDFKLLLERVLRDFFKDAFRFLTKSRSMEHISSYLMVRILDFLSSFFFLPQENRLEKSCLRSSFCRKQMINIGYYKVARRYEIFVPAAEQTNK